MAEPIRVNGNHIGIAHEHRGETYVTGTDNIEVAYDAMPDPDDEDGRTVGETSGRKVTVEDVQTKLDDFVRTNPDNRGKDSKGSYYRWGKGAKYYYKTGSEKSRNTDARRHTSRLRQRMLVVLEEPSQSKEGEKGKKLTST